MVNTIGVPVQLTPPAVNTGVTVMLATTGALVMLVAVKLAILPVPDAASPMLVLLLVQLYTVPAAVPLKVIAAVAVPLQKPWLATWFTTGIGFTVMVNITGVPEQVTPPLVKVGVTVMVAVIGAPVLLVATKLILPVPVAPSPMSILLLAQLYTVPATGPVKFTATGAPAHTVWLATAFTDGVGFTVMVKVFGVPVQVTPPLV